MPYEHCCPKCGSPFLIVVGVDGRKYTVCSSTTCTFNYKNISKDLPGKNRRHFKLTPEDYAVIHMESVEYSVGYLSKKWGVSRKHISRILKITNLSTYAEQVYNLSQCLNSC